MSARVAFLAWEPVGERMAGPPIRSLELARATAARCEVTLAAPGPPEPVEGLRRVEVGPADYAGLLKLAAESDVIVSQRFPPALVRRLARMPVRVVADLYNPSPLESLEATRLHAPRSRAIQRRAVALSVLGSCAAADFIVCASERQRDMWLGALSTHDLIDPEAVERDPSYRSVLDVVPFGLPAEPPSAPAGALRAAFPAIAPEDRVLLWGGGVWRWLDAELAIRATALLADLDPPVHLVMPGVERPGPTDAEHSRPAEEARGLARELGLEGSRVHFGGWIPYEERAGYLLGSDLGLSAHRDHLEARFAFRTRVLDYLWAELPVVATKGDTIADLVQAHGLGRTVAAGDASGFAAACRELLEDRSARESAVARIRELTPGMTWPVAAEPLVEFCAESPRRPPVGARALPLARATLAAYPTLLAKEWEDRGLDGVARRVGRNVARALGRRS